MTEPIFGTIRNGRVELDSPIDWPDGQRVAILPHLDGEPVGTELPEPELPVGRIVPYNGGPEHDKLLAEQMGRDPIERKPEEEAAFEKALRAYPKTLTPALSQRERGSSGIGS
jgi:hypothetical protein